MNEAEKLFDRFVNAVINYCINKLPSDTKLPSKSLQVLEIQDDLVINNRKIFDIRGLVSD